MEPEVRDNPDRQRYELVLGDHVVSIADYEIVGDIVVVPHIETDPQHRGHGMADRLMSGVVADLRRQNRRIVPVCPFAAAFIAAHPEHHDLRASAVAD